MAMIGQDPMQMIFQFKMHVSNHLVGGLEHKCYFSIYWDPN